MNRRTADNGFTLIELMVVLLLITLFSTLIVPSVVTATRQESLSTQRGKVAELLRFAYLQAVTRHHPVQVYVDPSRGACKVVIAQTPLPWLEQQPNSELLASLRLPESVRVELSRTEENSSAAADDTSITFSSDGRADGTLLTLTSAQGERCAIEVVATTGEVLEHEEEDL